jgi:hypothetical protein
MTTPNKREIEVQLTKLQKLIGCEGMNVVVDHNLPSYRTSWKLWDEDSALGQLDARFGSPYSDEADGFAAYFQGYNCTDYLPTVEECAKQHKERRYS